MRALGLLILSAIVDYGVGYTIVERTVQVPDEPESRTLDQLLQLRPVAPPKDVSQSLLQLYYLTQLIIIYRHDHPRAHKSHLDALVEELRDDRFQQKIRLALHGVPQLIEVDALRLFSQESWNLEDYTHFVNDRRRLIPAINRILNEVDAGQIKDEEFRKSLKRLQKESSEMTNKLVRKEAEELRELINSRKKFQNIWTVSDIMAAIFGKQDRETTEDFGKKYQVVDDGKPLDDGKVEEFWVVIEDDGKVDPTTSTVAPEQVLPAETEVSQETVDEPVVVEDTIAVEEGASEEPVAEPFHFDAENYERSESKAEVDAVAQEEVVEEQSESQTLDEVVEESFVEDEDENAADELHEFEFNEENYERSVPEEDDQGVSELQDSFPGELQSLDATVEALVKPEPELQSEEQKIVDDLEPAAKTDTITYPVDPQWVEDSVRPVGSAATGLDTKLPPKVVYNSEELPWPLEDGEESLQEQVIEAEEVEEPVTQSVPLWISEGHSDDEYEAREVPVEEGSELNEAYEFDETNVLESREGDDPVDSAAQIDPDTLRYVAFEILKIVSLLEDNAGFQGLRDRITVEDVDHLIEQLSMDDFVKMIPEKGVNRVEMINALERLIVEKNLEDSSEILAVLEQWKQGENADPDDEGYFDENYGLTGEGEDDAQRRMLDDDQLIVEESEGVVQAVDDPEDAREVIQLVDELEGELGADEELQDAEDDVNELESEQESKITEAEEEMELQNDSTETLEEDVEILESIPEVDKSEKSIVTGTKILQPFPEEVTEETEPLEEKRLQVVEELKKLQPFPEEVTEETEPLVEIKINPKTITVDLEANVTQLLPEKELPVPEEIQESSIEQLSEDEELDESPDDESGSIDLPKTVSNNTGIHPFPETLVATESLEVARAGTDEGSLNAERREEILEDQHPEP